MRFAAHQPNLLPYAGFWLKMDSADIFGLMPEAQFSKGDYTNRVLIGWEDKKQWLTLPVKQKLKQRISEVELSDEIRMDKVSKTIEQTYGKRRFWKDYGEKVTRAILEPSVLLSATRRRASVAGYGSQTTSARWARIGWLTSARSTTRTWMRMIAW